jgi:hypothetical protein
VAPSKVLVEEDREGLNRHNIHRVWRAHTDVAHTTLLVKYRVETIHCDEHVLFGTKWSRI